MAGKKDDVRVLYIFAYLLEWLSGIIILFAFGKDDKKLRKHSLQAILLGIISIIVVSFFSIMAIPLFGSAIALLVWLYGVYIGFEAYMGREISIPLISEYVK
ncbi:hypothetical protein M1439_03075 [Candidatus Marsarchaeota archaeon]|jgi:uncharacterized membrane protein|nr:hypothetical protein [Candidatus Marsarchaeota archaeon]MCL5092590.1 hypothetical protein [Candidatus Marsarchaeota archaeon]